MHSVWTCWNKDRKSGFSRRSWLSFIVGVRSELVRSYDRPPASPSGAIFILIFRSVAVWRFIWRSPHREQVRLEEGIGILVTGSSFFFVVTVFKNARKSRTWRWASGHIRSRHSDSVQHLLQTRVGDENLPLLSLSHFGSNSVVPPNFKLFAEFNSYLSFLSSAPRLSGLQAAYPCKEKPAFPYLQRALAYLRRALAIFWDAVATWPAVSFVIVVAQQRSPKSA